MAEFCIPPFKNNSTTCVFHSGVQVMDEQDYLEHMRRQLRRFSPAEQVDFFDEIASHIESRMENGSDDPSVEKRRLMDEMGTPEQMERALRDVHRPNHLVDLLLVLVPYLILPRLIQLLISAFYGPLQEWAVVDPHLYLGGRISFILAVLLATLGHRRRSVPLVIFWVTDSLCTLVSLMMREQRFIPGQEAILGSWIESLFLLAILIGLIFWLVQILKQHHFDMLLLIYALLPLLLMAANFISVQVALRSNVPNQVTWGLPFGLLGILGYQLFWATGMAIFFLFHSRDIRWIGLLLVGFNDVYPQIFAYSASLPLLLIWSLLLTLVFLGWVLDRRRRRANKLLVE
jgi:hypothetical protein